MKAVGVFVSMYDPKVGHEWGTDFDNSCEALAEVLACIQNRGWKLTEAEDPVKSLMGSILNECTYLIVQ